MSHFLKVELKKAGVTYDELGRRLTAIGIEETKPSIANKLGRGTFSATFFLAALKALGKETINLTDI